jgi:ABC-type uncharacterized transport system substrate-binding protein
MATIGIMHSGGSQANAQNIKIITDQLANNCTTPPVLDGNRVFYAGDPNTGNLSQIAQQFIKDDVYLIIAAGGSRSAQAAIDARGKAHNPIIVFTSVAPFILSNLDTNTTAGVCAHTSDHDVARLEWLLKLPLPGKRIGVLRNSSRGDHVNQKLDIDNAMTAHACVPRHRDINGPDTIKDIFNLFRGDIHALLVAADPFFNNDRQEIVSLADVPAIYQWCDFVDLGGLMSWGPSLSQCYTQAGAIAVQILNGTIKPPYPVWQPNDPNDFELCVSEARARGLKMWPLPAAITTCPQYKRKP